MLGKTHLFFGLTTSTIAVLLFDRTIQAMPLAESVLAGACGSLLPDIDEPGSMVSNAPRILGDIAARSLRRTVHGTPIQVLGALVSKVIGLVAAVLNAVTRTFARLTRLVAGGHRAGTHWLPVAIALTIGVYLVTSVPLGPYFALGFGVGYASHLVTDACTRSGIPLIPGARKRLHLLPRILRIRTGSAGETAFVLLYIALLVILGIDRLTGHPVTPPW